MFYECLSLLRCDFLHRTRHVLEDAIVQAQGLGGVGIDSDDTAVHNVVFGDIAAQENVNGHIGGVGV